MIEDPRSTADIEIAPDEPSERPGHAVSIAELDRVTIGRQVEGDEGEIIPSGSSGTVVAIWAGGAAYEVEFFRPVAALATVRAEAIIAHDPHPHR